MKPDYRTDAQKIMDCRDKHEIGVEQAKRIIARDNLRKDIDDAEDLHDIKRVLLEAFPALEHSHDY